MAIWLHPLLLPITCVSNVQMDHASPFQTFTFQKISNDIRNSSIQWVLTLGIAFWKFESPSGFQLPKWKFTWECGGSILTLSHTLNLLRAWNVTLGLHSWPATFVSPYLGRKPKARVATSNTTRMCFCRAFWWCEKNVVFTLILSLLNQLFIGKTCLV